MIENTSVMTTNINTNSNNQSYSEKLNSEYLEAKKQGFAGSYQ